MTSSVCTTHALGPSSPLHEDYQRFLQLGQRRAPHNLQVNERGYRSGTINTDALGLRYSHLAGQRFCAAEADAARRVNLLVGGSTALGIGASCDEHTVASQLSLLTGEVWLSLAGCGLNASQELLLFLTHQHRFDDVGHVVLLSGVNTLAHEALGEVLAGPHDPRYAKAHRAYLNSFNEGMPATGPAVRESLWQRLGHALAPRRDQPVPDWPLSAPTQRLARAADCIGRTLRQWDRLLADSHTTLTFILQPLLPWCRDHLPAGERAMLAARWQQPANFERLLEGTFASHLQMDFFRRIKSQAQPVPCYDMNSMLSSALAFDAELFVDRLHMNDLGYHALAQVITAKLGLTQDQHGQRKAPPIKLV